MKKKLHYITAKQISAGGRQEPAWFCVSAQDRSGLLHCVNVPIECAGQGVAELERLARERGMNEIATYLELLAAHPRNQVACDDRAG